MSSFARATSSLSDWPRRTGAAFFLIWQPIQPVRLFARLRRVAC